MSTTAGIRRLIAARGRAGRIQTAVALALVVVCGAVAVAEILPALADPAQSDARPAPQEDLAAIVAAASSCPALTPARLAASLMAASGFDSTRVTSTGATGIAALTGEEWTRWRPWPEANRRDDRASIFALAHRTCDFVGQLRAAKLSADPWQAAVAAEDVGLPAVSKAHHIPAGAQHHVDTVSAYADWYASQPQLSRSALTQAPKRQLDVPAQSTDAIPVPDAYRPDVLAAGHACAEVTPARVAAQLMAASRFNPNLTGPDSLQGIAQFRPEAWSRYRPSATASPWNPHDAIPALGTAMCDMLGQLSGFRSSDPPYVLALAAFQWGADTVRATGGVPHLDGMRQLADVVPKYLRYYAENDKLTTTPTAPSGTSSAASSPARSALPKAASTAAPVPAAPPPPPHGRALVSRESGKCLSATAGGDGKPLVLATCNGSVYQQWQAYLDGTIRATNLCMDSPWGSTAWATNLQLANCTAVPAQHFSLNDAHQIGYAGLCVDVSSHETADGTSIILWPCTGQDNQNWSWR